MDDVCSNSSVRIHETSKIWRKNRRNCWVLLDVTVFFHCDLEIQLHVLAICHKFCWNVFQSAFIFFARDWAAFGSHFASQDEINARCALFSTATARTLAIASAKAGCRNLTILRSRHFISTKKFHQFHVSKLVTSKCQGATKSGLEVLPPNTCFNRNFNIRFWCHIYEQFNKLPFVISDMENWKINRWYYFRYGEHFKFSIYLNNQMLSILFISILPFVFMRPVLYPSGLSSSVFMR